MKTACDMLRLELAEYAEEKFGKLQKFLALEPDRLDHRDLLIRTVEDQIQGLRGAVAEYLGRPELLADPTLGPVMKAVIRDFDVLEEILTRAAAADNERRGAKLQFPTLKAIADDLYAIGMQVELEDEEDDFSGAGVLVEVRLQVLDDGYWRLWHGDPSWDTDHRGYWGASLLVPLSSKKACMGVARDLKAEAQDQYAQRQP